APTIGEVFEWEPELRIVAIDIPIGLTEAGRRECDVEARKKLGAPRCHSVFSAPLRNMLGTKKYKEACERGRQADGRAISMQTWSIMPKVREADEYLRAHREHRAKVYEVHPELSFWVWNDEVAMRSSKKTLAGRNERKELVASKFGSAVQEAREHLPKGEYACDDLLDAFAALFTALRIASQTATTLPNQCNFDSCDIPMRIVA
ncbi:MAG: DUF429 domain-containing protein, partial [Proteobacteria bacterium]|nr:DUF429 domain-containing protein [Pseudomonadota bacterium]